jgi:hypothetical protein
MSGLDNKSMFLLKRVSPYIIFILNICVLEIILKKPQFIFWLAPIAVFITLFLVWFIAKGALDTKSSLRFMAVCFLLQISFILSFLFFEKMIIKQIFSILAILLISIHQEYLFNFLYNTNKYRPYSLENLTIAINLLTFIFWAVAIFGFMVFMNFSLVLSVILMAVFSFINLVLFFLSSKIEIQKNWQFILSSVVIILEIFAILSWFPFNFYLEAIFISTAYYALINLIRISIFENNSLKKSFYPMSAFLILWILSFITARWV